MSRTYRKTRIAKRRKRNKARLFLLSAFLLVCGIIYIAFPGTPSDQQEHHLQATEKQTKPEKKKTGKHKKEKTRSEIVTKNDNKQLDDYLKSIDFSGTALIVNEGKIVTSKGYSYANREEKVPNTPDTVYYIGSTQKAIIAASILQLEEKGLLSVTDPVSTYIPDFPNGSNITLYNLLTHTSGIRGHIEGNGYISPEDLLKDIKTQGIKNPPGKWDYRDSNYSVLAYIVSKLSGQSLQTYVTNHIFKPLKHGTRRILQILC